MQFKQGADVYTAGGDRVGTIDRVVIDPENQEVTHVVVQKGLLFTQDKVVPMSLVDSSTEDKVILRESVDDLDQLPDFEETQYIRAEQDTPSQSDDTAWAYPLYWYPPIGPWWTSGFYDGYTEPKYIATIEQNIPEGTVALKEGARVFGSDAEQVGNIERVLTDAVENRVTHLVISDGLLMKNSKLIPSGWVRHVSEDEVHLSVASDLIERLSEYDLQD